MKICYITEMPFNAEIISPQTKNMGVLFTQMQGLGASHIYLNTVINNLNLLHDYDVCIFIYPKSKPEMLLLVDEIKKRTRLVLNQEGPRDFWYDWKPKQQKLLLRAFNLCDMFFANNASDVDFFKGYMGDKVVLSPVSFHRETIIKNDMGVKQEKILLGGNMCKWYGGLSSYYIAKDIGIPISIPSMGRKQVGEEILTENTNYVSFLEYDSWVSFVSTHKYLVHMMSEIGGGNVVLLASALGIPCIGNELWDTQRICQPKLSIKEWELNKGKSLLKKLKENKKFYQECSKEAKENAYKFFEKDVVSKIQSKNLERLFQ